MDLEKIITNLEEKIKIAKVKEKQRKEKLEQDIQYLESLVKAKRLESQSNSGFVLVKEGKFIIEKYDAFFETDDINIATMYASAKIARSRMRANRLKGYLPIYINKDMESLDFLKL